MQLISRRGLLRGLVAMPAVVAAGRLMPISAAKLILPPRLVLPDDDWLYFNNGDKWRIQRDPHGLIFANPPEQAMEFFLEFQLNPNFEQLRHQLGGIWDMSKGNDAE